MTAPRFLEDVEWFWTFVFHSFHLRGLVLGTGGIYDHLRVGCIKRCVCVLFY